MTDQADARDRELLEAEQQATVSPYSFSDVDRIQRHLWEGEARGLLYPRRPDSQVTPLGRTSQRGSALPVTAGAMTHEEKTP